MDKTGRYTLSSSVLNTENEIRNFAVVRYHREVLNVALQRLEEIGPDERENSHATIRISPEGFSEIKKRIQDFRQEILQIATDNCNASQIYHINMQFYPVTKGLQ